MNQPPPVPLHELLDALRAEGFVIGVDDHLRVGRLIALEGAWSLDQLEIALGAMLVGDVRERATFEAAFRRFFAPAIEVAAPATLTPVAVRPRRWWPLVAGALVVAVAAIALVWSRGRGGEAPAPSRSEPTIEITDVTPTAEPGSAAAPVPAPAPVAAQAPRSAPLPPRAPELALGPTLTIAALGLAALLAGLLVWSSRRARRRGFVPGPWNFRLRPPPDQRAAFHGAAAIEDGAAHLTWQSEQEGIHTIDVERTLALTIDGGGYPRIVYQPPPPAPTYVVLEDDGPHTRTWRGVTDELLSRLALEGVELRRYTFDESPERCVARDGSETVSLDELAEHHDALVVIGDGERAWDPVSDRDADWLETLRSFHHRLWLNPLPPERWSAGAHRIAAATPMEHATADGLGALDPGADRRDDDTHPYPAVIELAPGSALAAAALRDHLGRDAFRCLALGAVIGDPDVDLARWLAHRFELVLDGEAWLRLLALSCYRDGRWPAGLRDHLVAALRAEDPAAEAAARAAHLELLADAEPTPGSVAHLRWRLAAAQERIELGEPAAKAELASLASSPIHGEAVGAMAAFGLPPRGRSVRGLGALGLLVLGVGVFFAAPHLASPAAPDPAGAYRVELQLPRDSRLLPVVELLVEAQGHEPPLVRARLDLTEAERSGIDGSDRDRWRLALVDDPRPGVAPRDLSAAPDLVATFGAGAYADDLEHRYAIEIGLEDTRATERFDLRVPSWTPRPMPATSPLRWRWLPAALLALLALLVLGDAVPRALRIAGAGAVLAGGIALHVTAPSWLSLAPSSATAAPWIPAMDLGGGDAPLGVDTTGMVTIAGKSFTMGSPARTVKDFPYADPEHEVTVATFLLDSTEVSGADLLPTTNVTWSAADAHCRGLGKRLPTSAEWELAATSDGIDPGAQRLQPEPSPVGSRAGDGTVDGVFDLLGNVMEWTADDWPGRPGFKIVRGASHKVAAEAGWYASIQARVPLAADSFDQEVGFRCAADVAAPDTAKLVELGVEVYKSQGCGACHSTNGSDRAGASLNFRPTSFEGGETFAALVGDGKRFPITRDYLIYELMTPSDLIAAGFGAVMPSYEGRLSSEELDALVAYLESIAMTVEPVALAVDAGVPPIDGGGGARKPPAPVLAGSVIQQTLRSHQSELVTCYTDVQKKDLLLATGTLEVLIQIDSASGRVTQAEASGLDERAMDPVKSCIEAAVKAIEFPTVAGGALVTASYKLTFRAPEFLADGTCPDVDTCRTMLRPPTCCRKLLSKFDGDGDGIQDDEDLCAEETEDEDDFEDEDGCPEPDNDRDRIEDVDDVCPNEPETYNGAEDEDGCPDKGKVVITDTKLVILEPILFGSGSSTIKSSMRGRLDEVAATMEGNPDIKRVEIQGHCDEKEGEDEAAGFALAAARAEAVLAYLERKGIESERLVAQSYAATAPRNEKHTAKALAQNRRVDYLILERTDN